MSGDAAAIELTPPDLTPYRDGNTGIPYVSTFAAAAPGPHVMVMALIHGNEIGGAIALDRLFRRAVAPARGTLTLAFGNVAAYARLDTAQPHRSRYVDEDLNRVWGAEAPLPERTAAWNWTAPGNCVRWSTPWTCCSTCIP